MIKFLPFIVLISYLFSNSIFSQDLKELIVISKAHKLSTEYIARSGHNGNYCSAIQIISDMDGFTYDSYNGIVGEIDHKPGMDIVYLNSNERVLNVYKTGYKSLKLVFSEIEISLKSGQIWQVLITSESKIKPLPVTIQFMPIDAILYIDDTLANGNTHILSIGEHSISIIKEGYFPVEDVIAIDEKNVFFEWQLYQNPDLMLADTVLENLYLNPAPNAIEMVYVQGGTFIMGCTSEQNDCAEEERPAHEVVINDFLIGKYEVTQAQWHEVMRTNENLSGCNDCPMVNISWDGLLKFLRKLNSRTGKKYRLPTEAEWEYAARGGRLSTLLNGENIFQYAGDFNIEEVAWYSQNSNYKAHSVGQKKANELGIYDMSGNVWEWCNDRYSIDYYKQSPKKSPKGPSSWKDRVLRGGSWKNYSWSCRVASRHSENPKVFNNTIGFRLALDVE